MSQQEHIDRVVTVLSKVPPKKLRIIELVNEIPVRDGGLDYNELSKRQLEITLAIAEAKSYGTHTIQAVASLASIKPI